MAYRRKSRKKSTARRSTRRRVSGIGKKNDALLMIGGAVAGYVLGPKINDAITAKVGTTVDPKIIALAEVAIGFFGPKMLGLKGSAAMAGKVVGGLLIGSGAHLGAKEFGIVSGFAQVPMINGRVAGRRMNGYQDMKAIAGVPPVQAAGLSSLQVISGIYDN